MDIRGYLLGLIKSKNISIRELALRSGVRRQSIMAFFAGANIHLDNLDKILISLGCRIDIIHAKEPPKGMTKLPFNYDKRKLKRLCDKFGVRKIALFGSILTDDFKSTSDIDVLIDFITSPSLFELAMIEDELKKIFLTRRRLDIVTPNALSKYFREEVIKDSEVIYEKAA